MIKILIILLSTIANYAGALSPREIDHFQPPIQQSSPPRELLFDAKIEWYTTNRNFGDYLPQVTTFDGKGKLLASWTPHKFGVKNRPTFIFLHGGHGIGAMDVSSAQWARRELGANVLILDSYWSRGKNENWAAFNEYGANMRALDSIAAGKFVLEQGVDPDSIYLMGASQGGWAVLRVMSDTPFFKQYNKMFRAAIALYPVCVSQRHSSYKPQLGNYSGIVAIFTAGKDTATPIDQCDRDIFTSATFWKHYPDATHGFDAIFKGGLQEPPKGNYDGECYRALNVYNKYLICRSDSATEDMRNKVKTMVRMLTPYNTIQ